MIHTVCFGFVYLLRCTEKQFPQIRTKMIQQEVSGNNVFEFDLKKNELISDCTFDVTAVDISNLQDNGLKFYARNNKYGEDEINTAKIGKWMMFFEDTDTINEVWSKIKDGVKGGHLWRVRVSLRDLTKPIRNDNCVAVLFYTKDYTDTKDVISILDYLELSGIKSADQVIKYKTDEQTRAGVYSNKSKASIYSSITIRKRVKYAKKHY